MTGKGHRLSTFAFVLGATASPIAATFSFMGSTFPDSSEYMIFGKKRNRFHRRWTHWFIPWLGLAYICLQRAGWIVPRLSSLIDGRNAHFDVWACAGFWFMGCVLHILEDAWCGTVPFLQMSVGEKNFVLCSVLISLLALFVRFFTVDSFMEFLQALWRNI